MGYARIEAEAGGRARRICPNDIRDNRRRDGREGELARRREIEGERQARAKPPYARAQTRAGNQIALQKKKEKLRAITRSRQRTTQADSIRRKWTLYMPDKIRRNERNVKKALAGCEGE